VITARLPRFTKTSAFQLALIYAALFATSVALIFTVIYWSTVGYLERQTTATIEAEIQGLAEQFNRRGLGGLIEVVAERVRRDPDGRSVYLFADKNLRPLAGNLNKWPAGLNRTGGWENFQRTDGERKISVRARVLAVSPELTLLVGRDIRELENIRRVFEGTVFVGIGATLLLALLGGIVVGTSSRRRVAEINRMTRRIVAGDLRDRIPSSDGAGEYGELIDNLNAMFDQIASLLENVRHVGDGIAHDLRTPLTRLRARLESLATRGSANREELDACLDEADRLLATFTAILRIARLESRGYRSAFERCDIAKLATDVAELYQAVAEQDNIDFVCEAGQPAWASVDRQLIAQALTNLIDNALKYCGNPGSIKMRVESDNDNVRISVADNGRGIPVAERDHVLSRFVRLDAARDKPGNGLGLPLVKAIADQHGGTLVLDDNEPGLIVRLVLPRARER
jgi:signal transduction histidine kinase